jgi:crotonobetainyl-CoA:carnitine CoA-transferase CaiB-like acyl-CoA transferase
MMTEDTSGLLSADLLTGVRVLDLTNVLSGPFCTYQMVLLGAEVIKIENPRGGDLARQLGADPKLNEKNMGTSFLAQNSGKKSVTLNLKKPEAIELFLQLVKAADVVVENFRPGVMDRLGVGYETLRAVNPGLVFCSISGFGQEGPLRANPAYDQIVQGMSGVMSITGDEATGSSPLRVGFPLCDSVGGLTAAYAVVSALYAREKTGKGRYIDVSMLDSTLVMLGWVVSNYLSAGVTPRAIGNQNMTAAPSGTFQTANGLLNIAANKQEQFEGLCRLIGNEALITDARFTGRDQRKANRELLNAEITRSLLDDTAEAWEHKFNAAGVPAGRVLTVPQVLDHPQVQSRNLIQQIDSDILPGGFVRVTRAGYTMADGEPGVSSAPPGLGEHTADILAEVAVDAQRLAELKALGVV